MPVGIPSFEPEQKLIMKKLVLLGTLLAAGAIGLQDVSTGHGGTYRGPGDTVPPGGGGGGGGGGPSTPGPSGPSAPGPSGPNTPGPAGPAQIRPSAATVPRTKNRRAEKTLRVGLEPTAFRAAVGRSTNWARWPLAPRCRPTVPARPAIGIFAPIRSCLAFQEKPSALLPASRRQGPPLGRDGEAVRQQNLR